MTSCPYVCGGVCLSVVGGGGGAHVCKGKSGAISIWFSMEYLCDQLTKRLIHEFFVHSIFDYCSFHQAKDLVTYFSSTLSSVWTDSHM